MVGKGRAVGAARPVRVVGDKIEHGIGACHGAADSNVRLRAHKFSRVIGTGSRIGRSLTLA